MAKRKSTAKAQNTHTAEMIGIGLTAAAAAAAGAYFLYGSKNAKQNRTMVKSWALKAKAEALEALEKAEQMSKEEYDALIDKIGAGYAAVKSASKSDIADFKKEMKSHWAQIEKSAKNTIKKAPKKAAKKAAKKASKKKA